MNKTANRITAPITVLLVDDHALVRRGFRRLLDDEASITVVGEAGDGAEAIQKARALHPDVVLMDCAMPGMSGLLATREILRTCPKTAVLMLSMHSEETWVRQAVSTGARGFLLKGGADWDLGAAIKRVAAGELVLDPQLSKPLVHKEEGECRLSLREREILKLIVYGRSTREIAAQLNLSPNTVGVHRAKIMGALGLHKAADLILYAIRNRLVDIV